MGWPIYFPNVAAAPLDRHRIQQGGVHFRTYRALSIREVTVLPRFRDARGHITRMQNGNHRPLELGKRLALIAGLAILLAAGWRLWPSGTQRISQRSEAPVVMGTTSRLIAVGPANELRGAIAAARRELDRVEAAMSTYDEQSELSRFNRATAEVPVRLSAPTREVIAEALRFSRRTGGAFDITVRPLTKLWEDAARRDRLPSSEEIARAGRRVGFEHVSLSSTGATKHLAELEISLDAIAKGYAIHRAIEAMRRFPLTGGLVDVGGDIECFGRPLGDDAWRIAVQHPRADGRLLTLRLGGDMKTVAVCTSGDYRRFVTVEGRRYSHILDPRTGRPADVASSVTVIGPDAFRADAWATALTVLGPTDGFALLQSGNSGNSEDTGRSWQALIVLGGQRQAEVKMTKGFDQYVDASAGSAKRQEKIRAERVLDRKGMIEHNWANIPGRRQLQSTTTGD